MESRFGADFGHVRIHRDALAARSSRELGARAYTYGAHIAFGAHEYAPGSRAGRALIAHELAHTLQQRGGAPQLQRACLPAKDCQADEATLENFVQDTVSKPENIGKADKRKAACTKVPVDAACTSDGHGAEAPALTALLKTHYPSRVGFVAGVYVDKDMPASWAAVTRSCSAFMPPKPGSSCTFVPDVLEARAKLYQGGAKAVAGKSRQDWLSAALGTLTHETEHGRQNAAAPRPDAPGCKFADHRSNLSEMAAHLSEMHVYYRDALARSGPGRYDRFYGRFAFWVTNGREDIAGIVKDMRCKCDCAAVDQLITQTVDSVSAEQKWDSNERSLIHAELREPKWALNWPVKPPDAVNVNDLPTVAAAPFKLQ
jgi:hypothetical protein